MKIERNFTDGYSRFISGREFKDSGMLWLVNTILHLFGMVITIHPQTGEMKPAITTFRGFNEETNTECYEKVTKYLLDNIEEIIKDFD
jgi:hypothetical protein